MITVQFVAPGVTQAESSPIFSFGTYHHWPYNTVDRNVSQNHQARLHTALFDVTKAWIHVDLQTVRSIKTLKFWYKKERKCDNLINFLSFSAFKYNYARLKKKYNLIKPCPNIFFHP